jgi:hypothetical protein
MFSEGELDMAKGTEKGVCCCCHGSCFGIGFAACGLLFLLLGLGYLTMLPWWLNGWTVLGLLMLIKGIKRMACFKARE